MRRPRDAGQAPPGPRPGPKGPLPGAGAVLAAGAALLAGCTSAVRLDAECELALGCFDDAEVVCLDELATGTDDPACRTVEVEASSDDCAVSAGRLRVVRTAAGSASTSMDGEILEAGPLAGLAGFFSPNASCMPCGAGTATDDTTAGWAFFQDRSSSGDVVVDELVFVGRGVRYRLSFCALPRRP